MKLKKLKMPAKQEISTAELDMGEEMPAGSEMADELAGESEGEVGGEPKEAPSMDMLADVSDDDLMAEVKKRGLMGQLEGGEGEGEEMESEEEEYMS